ncbi:hypothetical protein FisN_23Lh069 [Fistulifera solaris]|uniref:Uncharacterized protein n=1 Tax=Fistulifera solaris TaxID=1519565 RepID=A0A1Z5KJR6_FISSO|nr:hypothetical protein FisN_23Lh069 [Fistulifera solaris]|eukprot:GAX26543.1 hypothetical protein FisN_23Lh069 [Fistulifera solaris]
MPRLRRVPQSPAAAASARRRRQCVVYVVIGVVVLRTIGTEYFFLKDMNDLIISSNIVEEHQAQTGQENELQQSHDSETPSNNDDDNSTEFSNSNDESAIRCSDLSKSPDMFLSCIRRSPKYTCQSINTTNVDLPLGSDSNCTSADQANPSLNAALREILPKVLNDLNIKSVIRYTDNDDAISDDWKMFPFWVQYFSLGASDEMAKLQTCFGKENIHFHRFDLTCTIPPPADLVWIGDLSFSSTPTRNALLYHIQESGIQYLMTNRLNATWFDSETTKDLSAPLYTSVDGSIQRLGVWKAPFVVQRQEYALEETRETDDSVTEDNGAENSPNYNEADSQDES